MAACGIVLGIATGGPGALTCGVAGGAFGGMVGGEIGSKGGAMLADLLYERVMK